MEDIFLNETNHKMLTTDDIYSGNLCKIRMPVRENGITPIDIKLQLCNFVMQACI